MKALLIRDAQNYRDKKKSSFFAFLVLGGNLGKQSLRFRAAITFFFGITVFLHQNQNTVNQKVDGRQFCARASLNYFRTSKASKVSAYLAVHP